MAGDGVERGEALAAAKSAGDVIGKRVVAAVDDNLGCMLGQGLALHLDQRRLLHYVSDYPVRNDRRRERGVLFQNSTVRV